MIDLHRSVLRIDLSDRYILPIKKGRETAFLGLVQKIRHGKLDRGGVVVEEVLEESRGERGVGNSGVFDGEDSGVSSKREDFGGDLEDGGEDVESTFSQGPSGVESECVGVGFCSERIIVVVVHGK